MGCSLSGLKNLYDSFNGNEEVYIGERRFRIVQQIGEGGYAYVYLVMEVLRDYTEDLKTLPEFALKKFIIQNAEQKELVEKEINNARRFNHPNLLPLLEYSTIKTTSTWESYLLFPLYREGTLLERLSLISLDVPSTKQFSPQIVLHIFKQICLGISEMHQSDPPYCHNDLKPGNVLLEKKGGKFSAVLMDFGSTLPAQRKVTTRREALEIQEWASQHCSAPFRAPELWDCPSEFFLDQRTDIWALGCTLYALMYGQSPFEYSLGESGGSLQLAVMSGHIKWPSKEKGVAYPESFRKLVLWMMHLNLSLRPFIQDVIVHVEKLEKTL